MNGIAKLPSLTLLRLRGEVGRNAASQVGKAFVDQNI
jgi:hypothetical protein